MNLNIVFAVNNKGFDMMAVALYSVIKNNQKHKLNFHIFHKNISENNIVRIKKLEKKFPNTHINFSDVDEDRFKGVEVNNKNVTTEAYFRYLAPELLQNEPKALYMDYDMLCLTDMEELYKTDLEDKYIGAVADYVVENSSDFQSYKPGIGFNKKEKYANSGLLLLDLEKLRTGNIMKTFWNNLQNKDKIIAHQYNFFADQTVMNLTFRDKIKFLDIKYNIFTTVLNDLKQKNPAIIHFTGTHKPLTYRNKYTSGYDDIYYSYYRECVNIIGDDNGLLIKNILKMLSKETDDKSNEIEVKNRQLSEAEVHIKHLKSHNNLQDTHIKAQEALLNSTLKLQKRVIKLIIKKIKGKTLRKTQ